ncbi:Ppx/GppA phosphatase family protein [Candidatus Methylomirabilis sp.]|uniref:Ppx/GppA phosphatase family protein n=1 Tax=Candidatus Methylomirabilis sp. TaxID=2032687 RepID=UPI002A5F818B|nr:Ppx/GppA phosphatase family protein [Candidatus Methylomirabilis sp.]
MAIYAAIDVGTNTLRLLVAEAADSGRFTILHQEQTIARLGEGLMPSRRLQDVPRQRSLTILRRFAETARRFKAMHVAAIATSAVREASNREEFVAAALRESGISLRVIDGSEEARLTLLGVRHGLRLGSERVLVMDIGGGSTEFILATGETIEAIVSTGLGVVKLTEAHLYSDPPTPGELEAVEQVVADRIGRLRAELPKLDGTVLIATAGTPTALAAIDLGLTVYTPDRVDGHRLSLTRTRQLLRVLTTKPLTERSKIPPLEPGRADLIVAGTTLIVTVMGALGYDEFMVSDSGLREGILLDLLRQHAA